MFLVIHLKISRKSFKKIHFKTREKVSLKIFLEFLGFFRKFLFISSCFLTRNIVTISSMRFSLRFPKKFSVKFLNTFFQIFFQGFFSGIPLQIQYKCAVPGQLTSQKIFQRFFLTGISQENPATLPPYIQGSSHLFI